METVYRMATALVRALRSRLFAAAALAVMTAAMVAVVTVNTHAVTVVDGDTSKVVLTLNEDPYYVLKTAGVTLGKDDVVQTAENGQRTASIEITRAFNVQINADGVSTLVAMTGGTVADALEKAQITVGEHDTLNADPAAPATEGMNLTIERVQYREHTKTEAIAYTNSTRYTNVLPKGKTQIKQAGQNGVKTLTYRDRIVDGQVVETELVGEAVTKKAKMWYDRMWSYTVELFRSMEIPVRTLECCSGDLADLKAKSVDVEAWSPRQQKYFEVGSCSNLTDAQSRRLGIRIKGEKGNYFAHTLNNTVAAPPRMLIALLENHYNEDGSVTVPEVLRPYMGGTAVLRRKERGI